MSCTQTACNAPERTHLNEPVPPIFVFGTDAPSQKRCISLGTLGMVRAANEG